MKYKRDLMKNTVIITIGKFSTQLVGFLLLPLYTSILSTEEYGSYDLLNTISIFLIPFITFLMEEAMFRFLIDAKTEKEKSEVISQTMCFSVISILIQCTLFFLIFKFFHYPYTEYLILFIISSILSTLAGSLCRGTSQFKLYAVFNFLSGLLNVLLNILFIAVIRMGLPGLFLSYIISNSVISLWILIKLKVYKDLSFKKINPKLMKSMLFYSLPLVPNSLSWIIINISDRLIIATFMGISYSGIYAIANKFPSIINTMYNFFYMAWKESSAKVVKEKNSAQYYNSIYKQLNNFLIAVTIMLLAFMPFIFPILIKNEYVEAYQYIPLLLFAIYFSNISSFYGGIFAAYKNTKVMGLSTVVSAILNVVINLALIKFIGLYAAILSTFVSMFIVFLYRKKKIKEYVTLEKTGYLWYSVLVCAILTFIYYSNNLIIILFGALLGTLYSIYINRDMIASMKNLVKEKVRKKRVKA